MTVTHVTLCNVNDSDGLRVLTASLDSAETSSSRGMITATEAVKLEPFLAANDIPVERW